jgi:type I restriction enzyme S subunit
MEGRELPVGWERCLLGDVVDYGRTQKAEPADIPDHAWVLELEDIEKDSSKLLSRSTFAERKSKSTKNAFDKGAVLYGKLRPYLNKVLLADEPGFCSTEIIPLLAGEGIAAGYLFHWLKSPEFLGYAEEVSHGINMPRLGTEAGRKAPMVLAPLNEQRRIAAKLDTTLAAVEACRQRLDGVAAILKRFRQAVLAAATSGELTREWREERGIAMASWRDCVFNDLVSESRTGLVRSSAEQYELGEGLMPYLKMDSIGESWGCSHDGLKGVRCEAAERKAYELGYGDWLFNTRNSLELVGKSCVWEGPKGIVFNNNILRVRFKSEVRPQWVEIYFRSPSGREILARVKSATTSVAAIYQRSLMALGIRVPSLAEQAELIDRVETFFTLADQLEARLNAARKVVDRLTPALLAKAFRGELVPQDPNDEPASVLLERIRAARQAEAGAGKPSRRGRPKAAANPDQLPLDAAPVPPDFLAGLLRECGALSERALLAVSELEPERFEQQLFRELERGTAREVQADGQVLLEAVG